MKDFIDSSNSMIGLPSSFRRTEIWFGIMGFLNPVPNAFTKASLAANCNPRNFIFCASSLLENIFFSLSDNIFLAKASKLFMDSIRLSLQISVPTP